MKKLIIILTLLIFQNILIANPINKDPNGYAYDDVVITEGFTHIYILQDNRISTWQVSPLKRIDYFDIEPLGSKDGLKKLFLSKDKKTIVVWNTMSIRSYDLESKKVIAKKVIESIDAVSTDKGVFTVHNTEQSKEQLKKYLAEKHPNLKVGDVAYLYEKRLALWGFKNLKLKKERIDFGLEDYPQPPNYMAYYKNKLLIVTNHYISVIGDDLKDWIGGIWLSSPYAVNFCIGSDFLATYVYDSDAYLNINTGKVFNKTDKEYKRLVCRSNVENERIIHDDTMLLKISRRSTHKREVIMIRKIIDRNTYRYIRLVLSRDGTKSKYKKYKIKGGKNR